MADVKKMFVFLDICTEKDENKASYSMVEYQNNLYMERIKSEGKYFYCKIGYIRMKVYKGNNYKSKNPVGNGGDTNGKIVISGTWQLEGRDR